MAEAVAGRLRDGGLALLEAGTGTGKSLAYLIPIALAVAEHPEDRAVVATYTINLQEQLLDRDVPVAQQALGRPLRAAVAKGWNNYLCRLRLKRLREGGRPWMEPLLLPDLAGLDHLAEWEESSPTGSRSELPEELDPELWDAVAAHPDRCTRRHCPFYEQCFFLTARRRMHEASIIITNQHMLLSDLAVRRQSGVPDASVLPEYRYLVIDEAHHVEDVAISHLGLELRRAAVSARLSRLSRMGPSEPRRHAEEALVWLNGIFEALYGVAARRGAGDPESGRSCSLLSGDVDGALEMAVNRAGASLEALAGEIERLAVAQALREAPESQEQEAELTALARWARRLQEELHFVMEAGDPDYVYWVEAPGRGETAVCAAPLDVGPILATELLRPPHACILTSATLGDPTSGFGSIRERLGISLSGAVPAQAASGAGAGRDGYEVDRGGEGFSVDEFGVRRMAVGQEGGIEVRVAPDGTVEARIPSPFCFASQAIVAVPSDAPAPDAPEYLAHLCALVGRMAAGIGGRTFVLFTSHRMLSEAAQRLREVASGHGLTILCQGQAPRSRLLDRFREGGGEGYLLLGTDSFWEGVDVPGRPLSCVVVARLPFPVPDQPVNQARAQRLRANLRNPFWEDALPRAILKFRQGFGRLIRTKDDRGAVVVADVRILSRPYGSAFLDALPRLDLVVAPAERLIREVVSWIGPA